MNLRLFKATGDTVNVSVSGSSARVALGHGGPHFEIYNSDTAVSFINFGDSSVEATTTAGRPVGPGVTLVTAIPLGATHIAAIGTAGKIYATPGTGA